MRLKLEQGTNNCQVLDDTYDNDLTGLEKALEFMAQQKQALKKTVILTDLLYHGSNPRDLYYQVAQLLQDKGINRIIGIGKQLADHAAIFQPLNAHFYSSVEALLNSKLLHSLREELVLAKGARDSGLEKITSQLQQKVHSTVLEVDLDAISHNLSVFQDKLNKKTKMMVIVKALAYGSSSFAIAHLLQHHCVDYIAVAYADEGIALREKGITLPIMVMNPTPTSFPALLSYQLEPALYSLKLLKALIEFLAAQNSGISAHLKLETGIHRLGLEGADMKELVLLLRTAPAIQVKSIYSHLAAAGTQQHDAYTHAQVKLFKQLAQHLEQSLSTQLTKHILSTTGILRFPEYQFDMVRLGIGLYGVSTDEGAQRHLAVANTLKTVISQIKQVPQGATIGYERKGVAQRPMQVAVLAIGYADGFSRALGNGQGKVWINGQLAPVVGHVCMDMTMVDVTDIDTEEGDEVIIFGRERPIAEVAAAAGTIAYEVLTNVSERVKRVYYTSQHTYQLPQSFVTSIPS